MQKALTMALLIGAFLFSRYVTSEEYPPGYLDQLRCEEGTFNNHPELGEICQAPAPKGSIYSVQAFSAPYGDTAKPYEHCPANAEGIAANANAGNEISIINTAMSTGTSPVCSVTYQMRPDSRFPWNGPRYFDILYTPYPPSPYCPPDESPLLTRFHPLNPDATDGFCWMPAAEDVPPPDCDIGDCDPPEEPQCFRGGSGQLVCFEDPNEKCSVETVNDEPVYSNCESGCGFVNDNFLCSEEPELPSLDDCLVTTNGYACPSDIPEPDDDIENPETPLPDMVKGDFKDVLRGVETRTDATNKLLSDQIARDAENTEKLALGLGKANQYLSAIDKNTKETAEALKGLASDGEALDLGNNSQYKAEIQAALGLTGEESIDDLTVSEVNLGSLKDDFAFSLGPSACPQPRAINMLGKTFYMEWGPFCQAFTVMGYLIMAAAYFFAAMIAFKGK